jgi:hypothetical protein
MFDQFSRDRTIVHFDAPEAGSEPLTWGQKAIFQDMQDSGNQFSMGGRLGLPEGSTIADAKARFAGVVSRHPALRMRLGTDSAGRLHQDIAASGELDLEILEIPDTADVLRCAADLMDAWPFARFDFQRDWPMRMAVLHHRGACRYLVWVLSHLVADGGAHVLLLGDLLAPADEPRRPHILDLARTEQQAPQRQLSRRAMAYWEAQLRHLPPQTFGDPVSSPDASTPRHQQVRFTSPAAHLAMLAIARRTGVDTARVTLALIATSLVRVTGVNPIPIKVMVNNRFRPGLADVIAPIAQNSVVIIDVGNASIDEVVARTRGASLTAGMRAYCDPDELTAVMARLDAERGYPATVTCRVNDQRAMVLRATEQSVATEVSPEQIKAQLDDTSLTWLGPRENMHEQANILIENRPDVVSLHMMWDVWSLSHAQVEAIVRGVELAALEAAFDPGARTGL